MYVVQTIAWKTDGIGKEAEFKYPCGVIISRDGKDLFVADYGNVCIRKVSILDGYTSTIAGIPGITRASLFASSFFII
jgi:hypothetical protein